MKVARFFKKLKLQDDVEFMGEKFFVSTVKLPIPILDVTFDGRGGELGSRMLWYETMAFKYGEDGQVHWNDEYCVRYEKKKNAIKGHYALLDAMKNNYKTNRQYWRAKHGREN